MNNFKRFSLLGFFATVAIPGVAVAQNTFEYKTLIPMLRVLGASVPAKDGDLQFSTSQIDFGEVATNSIQTRQLLASNSGNGVVQWSSVPQVGADGTFSVSATNCASVLSAREDCLVEVSFSPTEVGSFNGVLTFTSTLASSPHEVTLTGSAFNPVSMASATLPTANLGLPYVFDFKSLLTVTNETSPDKSLATWSGSGTLPSGLSLNPDTGLLQGTPGAQTAGTSYTVTGTYKNNQGQRTYVLVVNGAVLEAKQISAGYNMTCAVTPSGAAKCWGYGSYGTLGTGRTSNMNTPITVSGLGAGVASISAAHEHACAVTAAGAVSCWGNNEQGQLGIGTRDTRLSPAPVQNLASGAASVSVGKSHTCALTTAGGVKCWGAGSNGQLGNGTAPYYSTTPVDVTGLSSGVQQVVAGIHVSCALTSAGAVKCWGYNGFGTLGTGNTTSSSVPVDVQGLDSGVVQLAGSGVSMCAVMQSREVKCWGYNNQGQLGNGLLTTSTTPVTVVGLQANSVSVGQYHACAVTPSGSVKCWGVNDQGQLGDGSTTNRTTPVQVLGLTAGVTQVTAAAQHSCARLSTGASKCWGYGYYGQLGQASFSSTQAPVDVSP